LCRRCDLQLTERPESLRDFVTQFQSNRQLTLRLL
jgi:hypothetical protein